MLAQQEAKKLGNEQVGCSLGIYRRNFVLMTFNYHLGADLFRVYFNLIAYELVLLCD